jgi:proteasome lid subunit RPN8/RPN11
MAETTVSSIDPGRGRPLAERATLAPPLELPADELTRLERFARRGYPDEVCGLLLGRAGAHAIEVVEILEARNLAAERRRDRYLLDPQDWLAAEARARATGIDIVGVWHTHPDHPARPSATDLAAAWPDFSYLILAVRADGVTAVTAWRLAGDVFVEQPLREVRR